MINNFDELQVMGKNKEKEKLTDNFDEYLSNNNMFGILFFSKLIPDYLDIMTPIRKYIISKNVLKIIICICEDDEEDFKMTLEKMENLKGTYLDFKSEERNNFIKKYNIISLPKLIIIGKKGIILDCLNKERILNLNENDIKSWSNKLFVLNILKERKPELGSKGIISKHPHELIYSDHPMKIGYGKSGYICDICKKNFKYYIPNFYCSLCGFDVCDECYKIYSHE